jgi:hypothetical protein
MRQLDNGCDQNYWQEANHRPTPAEQVGGGEGISRQLSPGSFPTPHPSANFYSPEKAPPPKSPVVTRGGGRGNQLILAGKGGWGGAKPSLGTHPAVVVASV